MRGVGVGARVPAVGWGRGGGPQCGVGVRVEVPGVWGGGGGQDIAPWCGVGVLLLWGRGVVVLSYGAGTGCASMGLASRAGGRPPPHGKAFPCRVLG